MTDRGLLRWGQVIDELQALVMRGDLGKGLRLYQLPDGEWQIVSAPDESQTLLEHRLVGVEFFPSPAITLDGVPAVLDGRPVDSTEPPASKSLDPGQLAGPTTVYLTARRATEDDMWIQPANIVLAPGLVSGGSPLELFRPLALIRRGVILTLAIN
jgi:hypothetical protein